MTKQERDHVDNVARLGSIVCYNLGHYSMAAIHHVRHDGKGGNGKRDHMKVIGLCGYHHQTGGHGEAIHAGIKTFEDNFGTEQELLGQVTALIKGD